MTNVYFISGMGASCNVFDGLQLPNQYQKCYIEWKLQEQNETLENYTKRMMTDIDTTQPFILVGYSFGGVIIQEMSKYIAPQKTILLASIKNENQKPFSYSIGKTIRIEKLIKPWLFNDNLISWFFNRFVYKTEKKINLKEFLPQLNASYMRWAIHTILHWRPTIKIQKLYQIHGTKDHTIPYIRINRTYIGNHIDLFTIENAGHLLVFEKPNEVSAVLRNILEKRID